MEEDKFIHNKNCKVDRCGKFMFRPGLANPPKPYPPVIESAGYYICDVGVVVNIQILAEYLSQVHNGNLKSIPLDFLDIVYDIYE